MADAGPSRKDAASEAEEVTIANTGTDIETRVASARRERRAANAALWALRALLALMFAMAGLAKLGGEQAMVQMFATIGVGQWFRFVVGALEVSGAVGVLIPRLSGPAALGLVCLMAGATLANLFVLGASPWLPIGLLVASAVVAFGRRRRTGAPNGSARR